ncbi:MAG: RluA family pseudouridine synthase [Candidatus Zambryskibacteria bacterium]|nr:RluA family pseudouridine synthase [Candidatus Zambryskibacteria bacterium]
MADLSKNILYEDKDILVINKPAGLIVHPDGRTKESSVSDWFAKKYPEAKNVGEPIQLSSGQEVERPGVVHRIDRETSGVLILAKTKEGHTYLKEQFQNREIEKTYHLFVYGNVKDDRGTIDLPSGRSTGDFRKWSAKKGGTRGEIREAVTEFKVLKRSPDGLATFIEAKPKTGRTHQIRVHFQALHHPVVVDSLYAKNKPKLLGFERLALHARKITFKGMKGEEITAEAPYPEDFQKALKTLGL